jgi:hypothetical protein
LELTRLYNVASTIFSTERYFAGAAAGQSPWSTLLPLPFDFGVRARATCSLDADGPRDKGFARFAISIILSIFYLTLKANYLIIIYLLRLNKYTVEGGLSAIYLVILALRYKGIINVAKY